MPDVAGEVRASENAEAPVARAGWVRPLRSLRPPVPTSCSPGRSG
ncbi:hypothetical protein [Amycolatopsis arida]|nr:hypothetical protein [Amycolatopsis arida]